MIEMGITMAIAAILVAIAAPSFGSFTAGAQMRSATSSLIGDISRARSESLRTRRVVTICARDGASSQCGSDWTQGWIIFQDVNSDQTVDAGEKIFLLTEPLGGKVTFTADSPSSFTFRSSGTVSSNGALKLRYAGNSGRDLQVIAGGRVTSTVVP